MADDFTRLVDVKITDGKRGQMLEDLTAHCFGDALGQSDHQRCIDIGKDRRYDIKNQHQCAVSEHRREINGTLTGFDGIDCRTRQRRTDQRENIGGEHQEQNRGNQRLVAQHITAEPTDDTDTLGTGHRLILHLILSRSFTAGLKRTASVHSNAPPS